MSESMDELKAEALQLGAQVVAATLREGDDRTIRDRIRRLAGQSNEALSGVLSRLTPADRDRVRQVIESREVRLSDRQKRRFLAILERKI